MHAFSPVTCDGWKSPFHETAFVALEKTSLVVTYCLYSRIHKNRELLISVGPIPACLSLHVVGKARHKRMEVRWQCGLNSSEKVIIWVDGINESLNIVIRDVNAE